MKTRHQNKDNTEMDVDQGRRTRSSGQLRKHGRTLRSSSLANISKKPVRKPLPYRLRSKQVKATATSGSDTEEECHQNSSSLSISEPQTSSTKSSSLTKSVCKVNKSKTKETIVGCHFCNKVDDKFLLGDLKKCEDITAHINCLLFAPGLAQNGPPEEGIDGFLLEDIRKELKRGRFLKCSYCGKRGAIVGCAISHCNICYHFPCGIDNDSFNHFHHESSTYPSYCCAHRPATKVPHFKGKMLCTICQEMVKYTDKIKLIYLDCCQSYFHRTCTARLAYHHGELNLRCPNCQNKSEFVEHLKNNGIFVPACESLTGDFYTPSVSFECSAPDCKCTSGRYYNGDNEWELFTCDRCGSDAVHLACIGLTTDPLEWICEVCSIVT